MKHINKKRILFLVYFDHFHNFITYVSKNNIIVEVLGISNEMETKLPIPHPTNTCKSPFYKPRNAAEYKNHH